MMILNISCVAAGIVNCKFVSSLHSKMFYKEKDYSINKFIVKCERKKRTVCN
jgi:hypothetical protein